ncbi:MAG: hypothetical protein LBU42_08435 [Prevotellaceae bacterium]|jgi:hypothetical protein|nr:hypothetical protein [Prevotellaceae bacterium]
MKKILFLFAMLASVAATAQTLNIQIAGIDYSTKIITCDLSWTGRNTANHLAKVWVFIDYRAVTNNVPTGNWQRAPVTGATVTQNAAGSATASTVSGNTSGVWVTGASAVDNFTGQVILQLDKNASLPEKFNACIYATDFPPGAYYTTPGSVDFKGTLPFYITYNDGSLATVTSPTNYPPESGKTITAVTDATACPGIVAAVTTSAVTGANSDLTDHSNVYVLNGSNSSAPIAERGFLYSSSNVSPTTATGTKLTVSAGTGTMSYNWENTTYSTTFYVRAYAISNGTVMYGETLNFKTWSEQGQIVVSSAGYAYYSGDKCNYCIPGYTSVPPTTSTNQYWYNNSASCFIGGTSCGATGNLLGCNTNKCYAGTWYYQRTR